MATTNGDVAPETKSTNSLGIPAAEFVVSWTRVACVVL